MSKLICRGCRVQYFQVKDAENETTSEEMRFVIHTAVDGASALIENYMRRVGTAEQPEDGPCVDCNTGVPFMDGDPSMHASGQMCVAYEGGTGGPALASAALMGGSHQRKRKAGSGQIVDMKQVN
jgi:hypothetical protein